jgi:hypothetical protein
MRTSQNSVWAKFAEFAFHALGCIEGWSPTLSEIAELAGLESLQYEIEGFCAYAGAA